MRQIMISESGTFTLDRTIEVTDEEWESAVDPNTGLVTDLNVIAEALHNRGEGGTVCAQCSGFGRGFTLSLDDETRITTVSNNVTGNVIYDEDDDENEDNG